MSASAGKRTKGRCSHDVEPFTLDELEAIGKFYLKSHWSVRKPTRSKKTTSPPSQKMTSPVSVGRKRQLTHEKPRRLSKQITSESKVKKQCIVQPKKSRPSTTSSRKKEDWAVSLSFSGRSGSRQRSNSREKNTWSPSRVQSKNTAIVASDRVRSILPSSSSPIRSNSSARSAFGTPWTLLPPATVRPSPYFKN